MATPKIQPKKWRFSGGDRRLGGTRVGSARINTGMLTQGLTGAPRSQYVDKVTITNALGGKAYDPSLSYLKKKMRTNPNSLTRDFDMSDEDKIMSYYDKQKAKRANDVYTQSVDERGDLHVKRRPHRKYYDSRTLEGRRKRFQMGRGPDPDYVAPPPPILRKKAKGADYKESGDSRDKTQMSVRTFEGTKKFGKRTAAKKSKSSKLFSPGASMVKRSKASGRKEGRT